MRNLTVEQRARLAAANAEIREARFEELEQAEREANGK